MLIYGNNNYPVLYYSLLVLIISVSILIIVLLLTWRTNVRIDKDKASAYECGFNPFAESRYKFEVKFYLVSLLFIIFDVEIIYLFPWSIIVTMMPAFQIAMVIFFLLILALGLFYEIKLKAIEF
jgi:NADH-quinone oxidoreductase subunit A